MAGLEKFPSGSALMAEYPAPALLPLFPTGFVRSVGLLETCQVAKNAIALGTPE